MSKHAMPVAMRVVAGAIAVALTAAVAERAAAQAVPSSYTGTLDFVDPASAPDLGLVFGDAFTVMALLDPSLLGGFGPETIALDLPGHGFDLAIGDGALAFDQTADSAAGSGFPQALFDDGLLAGFDFSSSPFRAGGALYQVTLFEDGLEIATGLVETPEVVVTGSFAVSPD
jgi:hypothetical protein